MDIDDIGKWAATGSSTMQTPTIDEMVAMTKKLTAERDRSDIDLFKAVMKLGIAIVPCNHLAGRNMILSVPESMMARSQQAMTELIAEQAARIDGNPVGPMITTISH